jgi:hypothetical protein
MTFGAISWGMSRTYRTCPSRTLSEMAADDDVIRAYEDELGPEPPVPSSRGFWVVLGAMVVGGLFLLVEIFANRPLANSIGHAQDSLRRAQAAAEVALARDGDFSDADVAGLNEDVSDLSFRTGNEASVGPDDVSVAASETVWAAAVQARPGACFYIRLERGVDPRYGAGTECTGDAALLAAEPRW